MEPRSEITITKLFVGEINEWRICNFNCRKGHLHRPNCMWTAIIDCACSRFDRQYFSGDHTNSGTDACVHSKNRGGYAWYCVIWTLDAIKND